jgi:hypothetical protein
VFCAYEILHLLSVVFSMITAVYKFDCKLVINETQPASDQWTEGHAVIQTQVSERIYKFS